MNTEIERLMKNNHSYYLARRRACIRAEQILTQVGLDQFTEYVKVLTLFPVRLNGFRTEVSIPRVSVCVKFPEKHYDQFHRWIQECGWTPVLHDRHVEEKCDFTYPAGRRYVLETTFKLELNPFRVNQNLPKYKDIYRKNVSVYQEYDSIRIRISREVHIGDQVGDCIVKEVDIPQCVTPATVAVNVVCVTEE